MSGPWRRVGVVASAVATVAVLASAPAGARLPAARPASPFGIHVGPTVNTSRATGNQSETAVAVNPTDPKNIVAEATRQHGTGIFESISVDGGKTWATRIIANGDGLGTACCDESLAFDRFGNLFMTYLFSNSGQIPVALSTDGGQTFTLIAHLKPKAGAGPSVVGKANVGGAGRRSFGDQPTIATGAGSVWLTWTGGGGVIQAAGAPVTGLGQVGAFGTPEDAAGANLGDFGDIAIGPRGQVLVTYQNPTGGQHHSTIYTDLDPDGLGPLGFEPARVLTTTHVGGFDYIPAQPDRSVDAEAGLAWDRSGGTFNGRVYAVWTSEQPDESNDMNVMLQYSDDDGTTWSQPVRVNDDPGTNSQFMPKIALDQTTGVLAISWFDARNDLGQGGSGDTDGVPNDDAQIWAAVAAPGGTVLSKNFRVSAGTSNAKDQRTFFDYGDYAALAFEAGSFYPVWPDNSNSTGDNPNGALFRLDLYTAKVTVTPR